MQRACVIGWPVEHSRSPLIHRYWLKHYGIDGAYEKEAVRPEDARAVSRLARQRRLCRRQCHAAAQGSRAAGWRRWPTKRRARSAPPTRCGSTRPGGSAPAIPTPTASSPISTSRRPTGTRDAGRSWCLAPAARRGRSCTACWPRASRAILLANRTRGRAEALAQAFGPAVECGRLGGPRPRAGGCGLLVNTTSLGMTGKEPLDIDLAALPKDAVVADIVYSPLETRAARRGAGAGQPRRRWARHAAASGGAGLRALVRRAPRGDARRSGPMSRHRSERHDARHRPHRRDRHGEIGGGRAFRATRRAGVQRRCLRASPL